MEGRMRRCGGQLSPVRFKNQIPQQQQQQRKIPVVYYLCRNRYLEHPHFIQVAVSSPDGLYLRDVINRLDVLRGKGMASLYSWSCKRSYKNGFVWHDLSEDDLVLPAQGNEYVLKGSELLDHLSPSDWLHDNTSNPQLKNPEHPQQEVVISSRKQEVSSSSSSPAIVIKEAKSPSPPPQEDNLSSSPQQKAARSLSSLGTGSPGLAEYRIYKPDGTQDASTQTEDRGRRRSRPNIHTMGVSTDDVEYNESHQNRTPRSNEIGSEGISPTTTSSSASSSGSKIDTLESLIRAEINKVNNFRILEEEDVFVPTTRAKLKAANTLMQLITCGSISVKDHHSFGLIPTYKPRFSHTKYSSPLFASSMMLRELDCLSENPRTMGLTMAEKDYFNGSLIQTKVHKGAREGVPTLIRSPYSEDKSCNSPYSKRDGEIVLNSASSKCLPRTVIYTSCEQSRIETMMSPISDTRYSSAWLECSKSTALSSTKDVSKRITNVPSVKGSSLRLESLEEQKQKAIKSEESLLRELEL